MSTFIGRYRMIRIRRAVAPLAAATLLILLSACGTAAPTAAPAMEATQAPAVQPTQASVLEPSAPPPLPTATAQPALGTEGRPPATPSLQATSAPVVSTQPPVILEERMLEVEWPPHLRLGDSDTLRLTLLPSRDGYQISTEFAEHTAQNSAVTVARQAGYALWASARLDGAGFTLSPEGEQLRELPVGLPVTWRWTLTPRSAGRQRISLVLLLRWLPLEPAINSTRERELYSRSLTVEVTSFLGLTARQAAVAGLAGLGLGGAFSLPLAAYLLRPRGRRVRSAVPNNALVIEQPPGVELGAGEQSLLRTVFRSYARITLEAEFRSGYSGARTFLVLPVRVDGRSDAFTIAKLGEEAAIGREYDNYETFVKDTLPPITARIQEPPAAASAVRAPFRPAAIRYTFIGEPGKKPVSLRQALLEHPDPLLLEKLFSTFGPGWWLQRRPFVFRAAQEYDRMLPAHLSLEPAPGGVDGVVDGRAASADAAWKPGQVVRLKNFRAGDMRPGGNAISLSGLPLPGQPAMRVRWYHPHYADGMTGRITATRSSILRDLTSDLTLCGLADPLSDLESRLGERVRGTQSVQHGDLNLENILVGPGGIVWLIDFAQTREGHTLSDFAHLEAEIIAHLLAPAMGSAAAFADAWRRRIPVPPAFHLLEALESIAGRCLFNPADIREYRLALYLSTLGALKYNNLDSRQRQALFLAAALINSSL